VDEEPRVGDLPLGVRFLLRQRLLCSAAASSAVCVRPSRQPCALATDRGGQVILGTYCTCAVARCRDGAPRRDNASPAMETGSQGGQLHLEGEPTTGPIPATQSWVLVWLERSQRRRAPLRRWWRVRPTVVANGAIGGSGVRRVHPCGTTRSVATAAGCSPARRALPASGF